MASKKQRINKKFLPQRASYNRALKAFEKTYGLRDLPWRTTHDPYKIAISELMLQQTQADRVVPKYISFMKAFPTARVLARATPTLILKHWSGLGYNRRALYAQKMAQTVLELHGGVFPRTLETLQSLPGIGPYTARAIRVFAFNEPEIVIETNIRTVFLHHFYPLTRTRISDDKLKVLIEEMLDRTEPRRWYNLLMDYGSALKRAGNTIHRKSKHYTKQSRFSGSNREARGKIIRSLLQKPLSLTALVQTTALPKDRIIIALQTLMKEGMVKRSKGSYTLAHT